MITNVKEINNNNNVLVCKEFGCINDWTGQPTISHILVMSHYL